ncbi:hypothetical protein GCM10010136_28900 [Limoniibacter endophyticus]|uniref:Uncharacterized protein n=1 Tax=Limoniibacter endophyticus TaxID=1565040 RepID=A0A8J3DQN7_9HYPH|nr:hypothetical protein GCM10010136_28900 [Limoniibacter endophyticus]
MFEEPLSLPQFPFHLILGPLLQVKHRVIGYILYVDYLFDN